VKGEIVTETVSAFQNLIGEVHRQAEQQKKEVGISLLNINSRGGSVTEAMVIGRLVRKEGIGVNVDPSDVCASACVLILAGAMMRTFIDNVGIHRPYFEVPAQQISSEAGKASYGAMLQDIRSYFREMNVAENLADAMLRIPPEDVHYLTEREAKAYGLAMIDPVFQETLDLKQAQRFGLDRREYVKRKALADRNCQPPTPSVTGVSEVVPALNRWSACIDETLKTGRAPPQAIPDFSKHGTPAPGR
jgi:ATP-dependent protease ClpP protease subunit